MKFYSYFDGKTQFSQLFLGCIIFIFFGGGGGGGGGVDRVLVNSYLSQLVP